MQNNDLDEVITWAGTELRIDLNFQTPRPRNKVINKRMCNLLKLTPGTQRKICTELFTHFGNVLPNAQISDCDASLRVKVLPRHVNVICILVFIFIFTVMISFLRRNGKFLIKRVPSLWRHVQESHFSDFLKKILNPCSYKVAQFSWA